MYEFVNKIDSQQGTTDPEPCQHYEVHCGKCGWQGMEEQMRTIYKLNPFCSDDVIPEAGCPMCLSDLWLEYGG